MNYDCILTEVRGTGARKTGLITLNRPKQLNALNDALMDQLGHALKAFDADDGIGCDRRDRRREGVRGRRRHQRDGAARLRLVYRTDFISRNWETMREIRKPVIAAVAGFALGGGCELAMLADFVIAADNAKFGQPEIKLGIIPGAGGTQRLPRAISKAKAMDMVLTGRMMDAAEAERAGLVARVVPAAELLDVALAAAQTICENERAERDDGEGMRQPRLRGAARRRHPVRAPGFPFAVRDRRPEGRHGRVPEEAQARVQEPLRVRRRLKGVASGAGLSSRRAATGTGSRRGCWANRSAASRGGRCRCRRPPVGGIPTSSARMKSAS
jgi:enoyl-CoA hydratase